MRISMIVWGVALAILMLSSAASSSNCAYPHGGGSGNCASVADVPPRREVYEGGEIFDITHKFTLHTPVGISATGIGKFMTLLLSMKNGSDYNFSEMRLPVHAGTHVDAPGHFYDEYFDQGFDVDTLDLRVLNGPALLVDVPRDKNITAEVMKSLNIPKGVKRVLFRTLNTDRGLMYKKEFDTSFAGFKTDGAQWLVDNTDIKLVGHALLVDVPRDKNITAEVMKSLNIPKGVRRVLFRTLNTDRGLMHKKEFDTSYVGFMRDGAQWLVDNTDVKLVGVDYLSVAAFDDLIPSHLVFLKEREIILVEGLKLDGVEAGIYSVHCLPLRLVGAEGSPIRCILIK